MMLGLGSFPLLEMCDVMCEDVKHDSILCFFCFPFFKSMEKTFMLHLMQKVKKIALCGVSGTSLIVEQN